MEPRGLGRNEADSERNGADWDAPSTHGRASGGGADPEGSDAFVQTPGLASDAEREGQKGEAVWLLQPLRVLSHPDTLKAAWAQVRADAGSPRVDGVGIEQIDQEGEEAFLDELARKPTERGGPWAFRMSGIGWFKRRRF